MDPLGVDPPRGGVAVLEINQALCEVGGSNRKEDEREESERSDYAGSCHLSGVVEGERGRLQCRSTRLL